MPHRSRSTDVGSCLAVLATSRSDVHRLHALRAGSSPGAPCGGARLPDRRARYPYCRSLLSTYNITHAPDGTLAAVFPPKQLRRPPWPASNHGAGRAQLRFHGATEPVTLRFVAEHLLVHPSQRADGELAIEEPIRIGSAGVTGPDVADCLPDDAVMVVRQIAGIVDRSKTCLLYTSDAADD